MHINNVSSKISVRTIAWLAMLLVLFILGFGIAYIKITVMQPSFIGFCQWYRAAFENFLLSVPEGKEKLIPYVVFIVIPLGLFLRLIYSIGSRQLELKKLNSELYLKSVDLYSHKLMFNFNKPQYNFVCAYCNVKKLEMVLYSMMIYTKDGSYPELHSVEINFELVDGKEYSLTNMPINMWKLIYGIIDYGRYIKDFSYYFAGAGEPEGVREKIDDYRIKGLKQILSTPQENNFKWLSVIFFIMGIIYLFVFKDLFSIFPTSNDGLDYLFMPELIFIGISFIFDIFLIADKIRERKY